MASWDEPTGETPVVSEPPVPRPSPVDQAVATLFIAALVVTVAVGAFLYGRARTDATISSNTPVSSTVPIAAEDSTTTTTARRTNVSTPDTTAPVAVETVPPSTAAPAPTITAPATTAPSTTRPATTVTTAPPPTTTPSG
jgi:hypothetical protein